MAHEGDSRVLGHGDYAIAIICAIEFEMSAVRHMLDREHPSLPARSGDSNLYILGELSGNNVVLTYLPGTQGKGAAAIVATNLTRSFSSIQLRLLVGIGGGIPSSAHDIRLGDVVISMPEGRHGGVVQYDLGKDIEDGFQIKGFLCPPPAILRSAAVRMRSDHYASENKIAQSVSELASKSHRLSVFKRPSQGTDILFTKDSVHVVGESTCGDCNWWDIVKRDPRDSEAPEIHYGLIASGDRVIKSGVKRDQLAKSIGSVLCFEMEAAGIATDCSCLVIRGISDYSDSHKNDTWHHYAAATAAACAKELLFHITPIDTDKISRAATQRAASTRDKERSFVSTFQGVGINHTAGNLNIKGNVNISG